MSSLKAEVRAGVLHEIGVHLDDRLEIAMAELHEYVGAKKALVETGQKLALMAKKNIDEDIESGALDLEQAELIRRWLSRACGIVENLAVAAEVQSHRADGRVSEAKARVLEMAEMVRKERARVQELRKAEEAELAREAVQDAPGPVEEPRRGRATGTRPKKPVKARRTGAKDS